MNTGMYSVQQHIPRKYISTVARGKNQTQRAKEEINLNSYGKKCVDNSYGSVSRYCIRQRRR